LALAAVSGAITSAPTYVLWYWLLPRLTAARAAISQLAVPAIVAIAGVLFLGEALSLRLVLASLLMLGGVGLALAAKRHSVVVPVD
jgi:drug/metabolite transporter (DMT)-like permease